MNALIALYVRVQNALAREEGQFNVSGVTGLLILALVVLAIVALAIWIKPHVHVD